MKWFCHDYATVILSISFQITVFFSFFRSNLTVLDVLEGRTHTISLPIDLKTVFLVAEDKWLLVESKTNQWVDLHSISCYCSSLLTDYPTSLLFCLSVSFNSFWIWQHLCGWKLKEVRENYSKLKVTLQSNYKSVLEDHIEINSKNIITIMYDPYFFGLFPVITLRTHCVLAKLEILQNRSSVYPVFKGPQSPS